jgi:hypothetical protein
LNSDASKLRKKQSSATIEADVKRFVHQINTDDVFGTHRVGISLLVLLNLHLKLRSQMELITVLARELAIANARAGQFDERVALASELLETAPLHDGRSLSRNKPGGASGA